MQTVFLLRILFVQMRILPDPSLVQPSQVLPPSSTCSTLTCPIITPLDFVKVDAANDPFLNGAAGAPAVVSAVQAG